MDDAGRRLACKIASYGLINGFIVFYFLANDTTRTDARFRFKPLSRWIYSSPLESTPIRALSAFYPVMCGDTRSIMLSSKCKLCLFPAHSCLFFLDSRTER